MDEVVALAAATAAVALSAGGALLVWRRRRRGVRARGGTTVPAGSPAEPRGLRQALATTGQRFRSHLDAALGRAGAGEGVFEGLEEVLLSSDVGVPTTRVLLERLQDRLGTERGPVAVRDTLRETIEELVAGGGAVVPASKPWVVLVTGINGVGKTTTIGKLAALHAAAGRKVLLVAADTFRAAAIEQLAAWAERTNADFVRHGPGADPSAVAFDGIRAALGRGVDVVLVDTAGRLHTRTPLMEELRKVRRTIERELPAAPHETLLVLDATTGQNALSQARTFLEAAAVTGVIVTKLDGTARGGVVVAVGEELGIPVRYVGVGEGLFDLREFDPKEFAAGLLGAAR